MDYHPNTSIGSPFVSGESAWFWAIRIMQTPPSSRAAERQLTDDVIKCLDTLYRRRRIELLHVRIMRIWGLRGVAPNPARVRERSDWRIWHEAMDRLEGALRAKGIVAHAKLQDAAD